MSATLLVVEDEKEIRELLRRHVKNLRQKLGPAGSQVVETVLGVGYRLGLDRDA